MTDAQHWRGTEDLHTSAHSMQTLVLTLSWLPPLPPVVMHTQQTLHGTCLIESLFIAAADLYLHTDVNHLKTLAFPIENGSHFISENTGAEGLQLIWNMQHLRIKRNIVLHDENLKFLRYCHESD